MSKTREVLKNLSKIQFSNFLRAFNIAGDEFDKKCKEGLLLCLGKSGIKFSSCLNPGIMGVFHI